ncbi:SDR family NAD(P)-dependent oxidoreductase [Chloroflexota bacterium]
MRLENKVAVITGAGSGIGEVIAYTFVREGAKVAILGRTMEKLQKVADKINSEGGSCLPISTDVRELSQVQNAFKQTIDKYGKIDIWVNDAAFYTHKKFLEIDPKEWDLDIKTCYYGVLNSSHTVLPHMVEREYGKIVNILTDAALIGEYAESVYAGAKAAIAAFSKSVAKEVGRHHITINMVSPGFTKTPQNLHVREKYGEEKLIKAYPLRRLGEPQDLANAVLFFASDETSFVTGQTLSVSGGYTMA